MFQVNHVGKYKDQFRRFGKKTGIDIHFTIEKHELTKEMNHSLLEKVRCLLSNAQLDKSFWAEAMEYASHLMDRLSSTAIGGKTSLDIWSGGVAQNYDLLWVFGCPAYFNVKNDKLNLRVKKFVFLDVKRNTKRYKLCDPKKQEDCIE